MQNFPDVEPGDRIIKSGGSGQIVEVHMVQRDSKGMEARQAQDVSWA